LIMIADFSPLSIRVPAASRLPNKAPGERLIAEPLFIGIDVSKDWIDIADTQGRALRVSNESSAIAAAFTGPWSSCANMVCEATGGYERALMRVASELGLPLRRVHPNRARAFGQMTGRLAKTDVLDARMLADTFIAEDPTLDENVKIMRSCKGVGPKSAQAILARLPEIGVLNRRKIAALVGVAACAAMAVTDASAQPSRGGGRRNGGGAIGHAAPRVVAARTFGPRTRGFYPGRIRSGWIAPRFVMCSVWMAHRLGALAEFLGKRANIIRLFFIVPITFLGILQPLKPLPS
jgi:hypothetical protein